MAIGVDNNDIIGLTAADAQPASRHHSSQTQSFTRADGTPRFVALSAIPLTIRWDSNSRSRNPDHHVTNLARSAASIRRPSWSRWRFTGITANPGHFGPRPFPVWTTAMARSCRYPMLPDSTTFHSGFRRRSTEFHFRVFGKVREGNSTAEFRCLAAASRSTCAGAHREFETTLTAANAPLDRFARGDRRAMTLGQKRSALLFFGKAGYVGLPRGCGPIPMRCLETSNRAGIGGPQARTGVRHRHRQRDLRRNERETRILATSKRRVIERCGTPPHRAVV